MTDVEKEIDRKLAKIDMKLKEIRDIRVAMRQLQSRQDAASAKHEEDMREMNKKIDDKFDKIIFQMRLASLMIILFSGAITWMILAASK